MTTNIMNDGMLAPEWNEVLACPTVIRKLENVVRQEIYRDVAQVLVQYRASLQRRGDHGGEPGPLVPNSGAQKNDTEDSAG